MPPETELCLLNCGHGPFCTGCIDEWFVSAERRSCPLCRRCFAGSRQCTRLVAADVDQLCGGDGDGQSGRTASCLARSPKRARADAPATAAASSASRLQREAPRRRAAQPSPQAPPPKRQAVPAQQSVNRAENGGSQAQDCDATARASEALVAQRKAAGESSSLFVGVSWTRGNRKWAASISHTGSTKHLGLFDLEDAAARAHDAEARMLRGSEAHGGRGRRQATRYRLNFPTSEEQQRYGRLENSSLEESEEKPLRWDSAQDAELMRTVRKMGTEDWNQIAASLSILRTAGALRSRWYGVLKAEADELRCPVCSRQFTYHQAFRKHRETCKSSGWPVKAASAASAQPPDTARKTCKWLPPDEMPWSEEEETRLFAVVPSSGPPHRIGWWQEKAAALRSKRSGYALQQHYLSAFPAHRVLVDESYVPPAVVATVKELVATVKELVGSVEEEPRSSARPLSRPKPLWRNGSVVWVKQNKFPWWPAMVACEPSSSTHFKWHANADPSAPPSLYHVILFGHPGPLRAWIPAKGIRQWEGVTAESEQIRTKETIPKRYVADWPVALEQAEAAFNRRQRIGLLKSLPSRIATIRRNDSILETGATVAGTTAQPRELERARVAVCSAKLKIRATLREIEDRVEQQWRRQPNAAPLFRRSQVRAGKARFAQARRPPRLWFDPSEAEDAGWADGHSDSGLLWRGASALDMCPSGASLKTNACQQF
eukprot:COSAG04_NODE_852_length_9862_cov_6.945229_2_plen_717_part_00